MSHCRGSKEKVTYRPITAHGLFELYYYLESFDFSFVDARTLDPDTKFATFLGTIVDAIQHCFPIRFRETVNNKSDKVFGNWFGDEAKKSRDTLQLLTDLNKRHPHLVSREYLMSYRRTY